MIVSVDMPRGGAPPRVGPGSGVVGAQPPGQPGVLLVDHEGSRHGARGLRTFADHLRREELLRVGTPDVGVAAVDDRQTRPASRCWLIDVEGGIDPRAVGPFASDADRDRQARQLRAHQDDEDRLFWADVAADGTLTVGAYTGAFFEAADPAGEGTW